MIGFRPGLHNHSKAEELKNLYISRAYKGYIAQRHKEQLKEASRSDYKTFAKPLTVPHYLKDIPSLEQEEPPVWPHKTRVSSALARKAAQIPTMYTMS